ncbi:coniferyl aldehyde dehydrogenase [Parvibaculum sp.]|jgi:coniferyl-aldehyde dehydrogenase|uniref:coniferyl aldehyde dehydrogenase n=1 Tax=Parvibaculum sp. TaxID=2024848 RepID=UPI000C89B22D|nr:coniferyl aldehyde dehydrogenase [Parvibaculum sp.]MAB14349.1 coniferyl aldehyde dehydrogenase [Parvibaculum sp.]
MSVAEQNSQEADIEAISQSIRAILDKQKAAHIAEGPISAEKRIEWLDRAIALVVDNQKEIVEAMASDFGHRSHDQSLMADVMGSVNPLKHAKKHLRQWMKPEKRKVQFPLGLLGAKARVEYQPLGTVGIISPWNFPVNLTFTPLAGVFAAGNRAMIKPSEFTPATSELMARMFRSAFDETEVAVITGGPAVGQAFSKQPFDHLLFTGATSIAYHVMRAAAENLVPLTLELGGKSPVIISDTAKMDEAAAKVMTGKTLNAGQICLAPDYVFVPEAKLDSFVDEAQKSITKMYPTIKENPDYTSIVNQRHYDRINSYLDDAKQKGAKIVEINPANEDFSQQPTHKIPPTIVVNPTDDMKVMQDEIFGPVLPVKSYRSVTEVLDYVNGHARPLGLYYFGEDEKEERTVLDRTTSGGVTVNDVIMHVSMEDLPFGGVGPSGMGAYHGIDGFRTFSHAKAVYKQSNAKMVAEMFRPPYTSKSRKRLMGMIKK